MSKPFLLGLSLAGRRVVAVGGGRVTARRVKDFLAEGALVEVISPGLHPDLADLLGVDERLTWSPRVYSGPSDLDGAWLVHVGTGNAAVDAAVAEAAEDQRTWCVVASAATTGNARVPARTSLQTMAGQVSLAVHAGDDPRRAVGVRDELATHLTAAAAEYLASGEVDLRPRRRRGGWVALVGAGPGDAELMTRRAASLLAGADVVIADRLIPKSVLATLPAGVRVIDVGKIPGYHQVPQDEINRIIVAEALAGNGVVRLKGGDPYVLGRGGEERLACEAAGIPVEVVPGISSAISVPAAAGIPVTHRGLARGFSVVTAHDEIPELPTGGDHTVVLLMGVAKLRHTVDLLLEHGRAYHTPVGIIERGWTSGQRVTLGILADIVERAEAVGVTSPAVIVLGDCVTMAHGWAEAAAGTRRAFAVA